MTGELVKDMSDTLNELLRMHQVNLELMEALGNILKQVNQYAERNGIPLDDSTRHLISRAIALWNDIVSPPNLQHRERIRNYWWQHRAVK